MTTKITKRIVKGSSAVRVSKRPLKTFLFRVTETVTFEVEGQGRTYKEAAKDAGRRFRPCAGDGDSFTQFVAVEDRDVGLALEGEPEVGTPEDQDFSAEFEQGMEEVS